MDEVQKEDLQFWFYNHVFISGKSLDWALGLAAKEVGVSVEEASHYLQIDGRLATDGPGKWKLVEYPQTAAIQEGDIFVDIDWMMALLLDKTKLRGEALWRALSSIFKLSLEDARLEAEAFIMPEEESDE